MRALWLLPNGYEPFKQGPGLLVALAILLASVVLERIRRWRLRPRGAKFLPGLWPLGNMVTVISAITRNRFHKFFLKQHRRLGRTIVLNFLLNPWRVITACPKNLEHILQTNFENYVAVDLVRRGVVELDSHEWYMQRQDWRRILTVASLQETLSLVICRNARKLRNIMDSLDTAKPIDVCDLMKRFALDTIGEAAFGKCMDLLDSPDWMLLSSCSKAWHIVFWRSWLPRIVWRAMRLFGIGTESESREHLSNLHLYSHDVVRDLYHTASRESGKGSTDRARPKAHRSFLGLLVEEGRSRGERLSEDSLQDLVMNFLIVGPSATAQGLSWIVYCLCQHPDAEDRARQEVVDVCGACGPTSEAIPDLPYLQAVISEALRLYPSVPIDIRVAVAADTWPDGTFVPRGTEVLFDIYSMGRDESIWGEDAAKFRPERWLESTEGKPSVFEYPVFFAGPRECLSKALGVMLMKTCLAILLPQVSFKLALRSDEIRKGMQWTFDKGHGLPCFVRATTRRERVDDSQSDGESVSTSNTGISSEPESDSASSTSTSSRRSRRRKSGWTRQRRSKFWKSVREATPERWLESAALPPQLE